MAVGEPDAGGIGKRLHELGSIRRHRVARVQELQRMRASIPEKGLKTSSHVSASPTLAIAVGITTILAFSFPARSTNALIASSLSRPPLRS